MKIDRFEKGIKDIRGEVRLSPEKKELILSRLVSYLERNPVLKNPYYNTQPSFIYSILFSRSVYYAMFVILILGSGGYGTYNNAKNSLPGDRLYSMKVDVIEPLKYAMAVTPVAKVNVQSENLTERLIEAERLASQGRLSDSSGEEIENRLRVHADDISSVLESIDQSASGLSEIKLDIEARINAHQKILSKMEEKSKSKPASENISRNISRIKDVVGEQSEIASRNKNDTTKLSSVVIIEEVGLSSAVEEAHTGDVDYETKEKDTEKIIREAREKINKGRKGKAKINRQILEDSSTAILEAESALIRARENQKSGNKKEAIADLIESRKSAKEAQSAFRASLRVQEVDND